MGEYIFKQKKMKTLYIITWSLLLLTLLMMGIATVTSSDICAMIAGVLALLTVVGCLIIMVFENIKND